MAEGDDGPDDAIRWQAEQVANGIANVAADPGDASAKTEHRGRDQHPLGGPAVVVRARELPAGLIGQDDRDRAHRRTKRARLGQARLRDLADRIDVADHDEPPWLLILAAARPARDLGDRLELPVSERFISELAHLARSDQGPDTLDRRS